MKSNMTRNIFAQFHILEQLKLGINDAWHYYLQQIFVQPRWKELNEYLKDQI